MAAKDSVVQGSLITCIIFLILSLVGNFFMYQSMDAASKERTTAQERLSASENNVRTQSDKIKVMQTMLGIGQMTDAEFNAMLTSVGADEQMTLIEQQFVQDMSLLGPSVDAKNRNYHALPAFLMRSIRDLNLALIAARDEVVTLTAEKDAVIARETARADNAEKEKENLNTQLVQARAQFAKDREDHNLKQQQMQDLVVKTEQDKQQIVLVAKKEKSDLTKRAVSLQETIDVQKDTIQNLRNDEFESAQGRVVHVMPGGNLVFLNLGSADGLVTGVTFSVIDQDEVRVTDVEPKGQVEVTAIRGAHLAEARVIYNKTLQNPIIEDDKIFTPFWSAGQKVEIALVGLIDLEGDGRDDSERVKAMIRSAGATVSCHVDPTGAKAGELTFDTRFLVLGNESDNAGALAAVGKVKSEAKQLGITSISINKLLGYLRSLDAELVIPLGTASRASDFPAQSAPGISTRRPSTLSSLYDRDTPKRQDK